MHKCFDEIKAKVEEKLLSELSLKTSERETFDLRWQNESLVCIGGMNGEWQGAIGLPIEYEFTREKTNGEMAKRPTKDKIKLFMTYCPFCGESIREKKESQ